MKVKDKVILVTGAGGGMGRELVLNLIKKGARVVALDLNPTALQGTVEKAGELKDRVAPVVANITDRALIESLKDEVIGKFGQLDGLINNAGIIQKFSALADTPYAEIERVMNINFYGTLYVLKTFLPYLLQRPEAHVVNVASMGSFLPVPGQVTYGASKAAVKLMTEGLMCELADTHCQVSVVFPGSIATNIQKNSGASKVEISKELIEKNKGFLLTMPEDAAEVIVRGMERGKKRIKIGHDCKAMDKLTRLAPNLAGKLITKAMKGKIELE